MHNHTEGSSRRRLLGKIKNREVRGRGRANGTCYVGDNVGLVGHCKVFLRGYLGHWWGEGAGEKEGEEGKRGSFKKKQWKQITAGESL